MITKEQIRTIIEDALKGTEKFLVEVVILPGNKIQVFIDSDGNVSIGDCQALSRIIESRLDRDYEDYELTVSSSGIDRPLKYLRQYNKNIGREMNVSTQGGQTHTGVLSKVAESGIELEHPVKNPKKEKQKENTFLSFNEIKTAKIKPGFSK